MFLYYFHSSLIKFSNIIYIYNCMFTYRYNCMFYIFNIYIYIYIYIFIYIYIYIYIYEFHIFIHIFQMLQMFPGGHMFSQDHLGKRKCSYISSDWTHGAMILSQGNIGMLGGWYWRVYNERDDVHGKWGKRGYTGLRAMQQQR